MHARDRLLGWWIVGFRRSWCNEGSRSCYDDPELLPQELEDSVQDTRIRILAILLQEAYTLYNTVMTKKAEEQPLSQGLRLVFPDDLTQEGETCGLLTRNSLESLLRTELSRRRIGHLFDAADRVAGLPPCREDGTGKLAGAIR